MWTSYIFAFFFILSIFTANKITNLILIIPVLIGCLIQLIFTYLFLKESRKKHIVPFEYYPDTNDYKSVSLIICAKNEAINLKSQFSKIAELDYPLNLLEIIYVNDQSTDDTGMLMDEFALQYPWVKVLHIAPETSKELPGKKFALRAAVDLAQNDLILLTDADCVPHNPAWIKAMVTAQIENEADVILGYGTYERKDGNLNAFIQFETMHTAMQYMTYAGIGVAYMGVGRNLMYKSQLLKAAFRDPVLVHRMMMTTSGDDDLVISHLSANAKIVGIVTKNTHTQSIAPSDWTSYLKQKTRHSSSSKYYQKGAKAMLGLYALSHFVYWFGCLLLLTLWVCGSTQSLLYLTMALWVIVFFSKLLNYYKWKSRLDQKLSLVKIFIFDFFWTIYNVILSPYIFWKNKQKWN